MICSCCKYSLCCPYSTFCGVKGQSLLHPHAGFLSFDMSFLSGSLPQIPFPCLGLRPTRHFRELAHGSIQSAWVSAMWKDPCYVLCNGLYPCAQGRTHCCRHLALFKLNIFILQFDDTVPQTLGFSLLSSRNPLSPPPISPILLQ